MNDCIVLDCSAAEKVKFHVEAAARELSLERFANFESQLLKVQHGFIIALYYVIRCHNDLFVCL